MPICCRRWVSRLSSLAISWARAKSAFSICSTSPAKALSTVSSITSKFNRNERLSRFALPIALTQLGQIAMMTTDLALIGRLGDHVIAAAALAQIVLFVAFVLGMGIVSAVAPLAAQAFGARQPRMVRRALRVGLMSNRRTPAAASSRGAYRTAQVRMWP